MMLGNSPISWKSKKQGATSKSSSEAEYRSAMAHIASEVCWLVRLLTGLRITTITSVKLHYDNMPALHIAKNPVFHKRTKHKEVNCHFRRDNVLQGLLQLCYQNQLADVFTKVLPLPQHKDLLSKLRMIPTSPVPSLRGC